MTAHSLVYDLYISGPMGGKPAMNHPLFNRVASEARRAGLSVFNPAELDAMLSARERKLYTWADYMRRDLEALLRSRGVMLLPGWRKSKGARIEALVAQTIGLTIFEFVPKRKRHK